MSQIAALNPGNRDLSRLTGAALVIRPNTPLVIRPDTRRTPEVITYPPERRRRSGSVALYRCRIDASSRSRSAAPRASPPRGSAAAAGERGPPHDHRIGVVPPLVTASEAAPRGS